ncbi:MAG: hypothetical protein Q4D62_14780, partial [Planctomycetia bacterium]|nr:hypothetical protein [Planctomycetia bacterium]
FEKNNGRGIVNEVTSKKRSTLQGTIESYRADWNDPEKTVIGGNVYLVNPNGITMRKGFTFKGDRFGATTMSLSDVVACLTYVNDGKTPQPEFYGVLIQPSGWDSAGKEKDKVFTITKGSLRLNKKGAISGNANFDLGENDDFYAQTPAGQNLRIGNVSLAKNASMYLESGKNLNVRDITGTSWEVEEYDDELEKNVQKTDYSNITLYAANRLRIRSANKVDANVAGQDIRLSKSNASSLGTLTVRMGSDYPTVTKFSIAKGTQVAGLNIRTYSNTTDYTEKEYKGFTTPKRITQKNYTQYLQAVNVEEDKI